jgi:hypothetical protein
LAASASLCIVVYLQRILLYSIPIDLGGAVEIIFEMIGVVFLIWFPGVMYIRARAFGDRSFFPFVLFYAFIVFINNPVNRWTWENALIAIVACAALSVCAIFNFKFGLNRGMYLKSFLGSLAVVSLQTSFRMVLW